MRKIVNFWPGKRGKAARGERARPKNKPTRTKPESKPPKAKKDPNRSPSLSRHVSSALSHNSGVGSQPRPPASSDPKYGLEGQQQQRKHQPPGAWPNSTGTHAPGTFHVDQKSPQEERYRHDQASNIRLDNRGQLRPQPGQWGPVPVGHTQQQFDRPATGYGQDPQRRQHPVQIQDGFPGTKAQQLSTPQYAQGSPQRSSIINANYSPPRNPAQHGQLLPTAHEPRPGHTSDSTRYPQQLGGSRLSLQHQYQVSPDHHSGQNHKYTKSDPAVPATTPQQAHIPPTATGNQHKNGWKPPEFVVEGFQDAGKDLAAEAVTKLVHLGIEQANGRYQPPSSGMDTHATSKSDGNDLEDKPGDDMSTMVAPTPNRHPVNQQPPRAGGQGYQSQDVSNTTQNSNLRAHQIPSSPPFSSGPFSSYSVAERPNVAFGDELIFPRRFGTYPGAKVSWFDESKSYSETFLAFTSWNRSNSRSVVTFVPLPLVTAGNEHMHTHFVHTYGDLWFDQDYEKHAGRALCICNLFEIDHSRL